MVKNADFEFIWACNVYLRMCHLKQYQFVICWIGPWVLKAKTLSLKAPSKIYSRLHSKFFFYFTEKTSLDISYESSAKQKKKNKKKLSSAAVVIKQYHNNTMYCRQKGLSKQCRPRSECHKMWHLIRVYNVCHSHQQVLKLNCSNFRTNMVMSSSVPKIGLMVY